jgi:hypothetical protein
VKAITFPLAQVNGETESINPALVIAVASTKPPAMSNWN